MNDCAKLAVAYGISHRRNQMANKRSRATAYPNGEYWVETLSTDDRARLLQKQSWEIREAAFYFYDYQYYDETFGIEPGLKEVEELCRILIEDLKHGKLETPYSVSGVSFLTHLPVETYIKWAEDHWDSHYPNTPLPNIVIAYDEQAKSSVDAVSQVQYLKEQGIPIDQLIKLLREVYDFSRTADGKMKTTRAIKALDDYKALEGAKNLEKRYPDLPSTKLLETVIRILRQGEKK